MTENKHSSNVFKRKLLENEKSTFWGSANVDAELGILDLDVPRQQVLTGYLVVPIDALIEADQYGITAILAKCGNTEYQISTYRLKEIGNRLSDRVLSPVGKWHRTAGPAIKMKEPQKPTVADIRRKYGKDALRRGSECA